MPRATTSRRAGTIVYVGPTLPAAEAAALLPRATIRGPVAVGDVLRVIAERPRRIAIIDGYFERMAAVWHKEILLALEAGIEVWGAASMGALRAAELAPFGMRGAGTIYHAFARGELVADDEVAVAHLPAEYGYRATSIALVDLRAGIARAALDPPTKQHLLDLARARFYRERSWEQLAADAAGLVHAEIIEAMARTPSRKADDARELLATLAAARPAKPRSIEVPRTWALRQLRATLATTPRSRTRERAPGAPRPRRRAR